MVFENIFKQTSSCNNVHHPMSNPQYINDVNTNQGKQYMAYKTRRQSNILKKNKAIVEGFVESMTATQRNKSDLSRVKELQQQMDGFLLTLGAANKKLMEEAKKELSISSESSNKYAIDPGTVGNSKYEGCYVDSSERKLPTFAGVLTPQQCAQRAHDLGKSVYGMQNSAGPTGECWIGNSLQKAKTGGIGTKVEPTWATGAEGKMAIHQLALGYNGDLIGLQSPESDFATIASFLGQDGKDKKGIKKLVALAKEMKNHVWNSKSAQAGCPFGSPAINNVKATYGMSCLADQQKDLMNSVKKLGNPALVLAAAAAEEVTLAKAGKIVVPGNATKHFADAQGKTQAAVEINAQEWGDPAFGCKKNFIASYNCGLGSNTQRVELSAEANGKMVNLNCENVCEGAPFKLMMQDDGNLVIYTESGTAVWSSNTAGKNGDTPNPEWKNGKGNLGPSIKSGEMINENQYLLSPSATTMAIVQSDGNFVIYKTLSGCVKNDNGNYYGRAWTNAVYSIAENDISNLGKVGNVTDSNKVRNFPNSLLSNSGSTFYKISGFRIPSDPDMGLEKNKTLEEYKSIAASNSNIEIFWHDTTNNIAYFYSRNCPPKVQCPGTEFPILQSRIAQSNADLYIKNKGVSSNDTCPKESEGVTLSTYNSYKLGGDMKKCSPCGLAEAIHDGMCAEDAAQAKAMAKGQEILSEMEKLAATSSELQQLQPAMRDELYNKISDYKNVYDRIQKNQIGTETIGAQKDDSDLNVVAENFQYVMWSVIAIMAVIVTMKLVKRNN